jgi:WD40 repeat protein
MENDMISTFDDFTKSCKAVKYSEGGHYLAIGFVNQIHIVCPYRLTTKKILSGHSGHITHFKWKDRDRYLLSFCSNSTALVWDSHNDWKTVAEHYFTSKTHKFLSVDYDPEFDLLVCCCTDYSVKIFKNKGSDIFHTYDTDDTIFTCVLISKRFKVCFFGCEDGSVRVYLWPFIRIGRSKFEFMHIAVHQEKVTDMKLAYNHEHLITASSDGSIFFLGVSEVQKGKDMNVGDILASLNPQDENEEDDDDIGKISNTFNLNEFALLSSKIEEVRRKFIRGFLIFF